MQDIIEQIRSYILGIWRYRWYALITAWLVCLIAWPLIFKLPNQYEALARFSVDIDSVILQELGIPAPKDIEARLYAIPGLLLSEENRETIVRKVETALVEDGISVADNLPLLVSSGLRVRGNNRGNTFNIAFTGENPQIAKYSVQAALELFDDKISTIANAHFSKTEVFLQQEILEKETEIEEIQKQLANFQAQNDALLVDRNTHSRQLDQTKAELAKAKLDLQQAEIRRESYLKDLKGDTPTFGLGLGLPVIPPKASVAARSPAVITSSGAVLLSYQEFKETKESSLPEYARWQQMLADLDTALIDKTEQHPDVQNLQSRVAIQRSKLDEKLAEQYQAYRDAQAEIRNRANQTESVSSPRTNEPVARTANPLVEQLNLKLSTEKSNIESLKVKVEEFQRRVTELTKQQGQIPLIQAQNDKLRDELSVIQLDLAGLKKKNDQIDRSKEILEFEGVRFDVLSAPSLPNKPVGPKRALFILGTLIFGLGAGLALAFAISQLKPTFDTRRSLAMAIPVPILGSVSAVLPPEKLRRQKLSLFIYFGLFAGLFTLCASLILLDKQGVGISFI